MRLPLSALQTTEVHVGEGALSALAGAAERAGCVLLVTDASVAATPWLEATLEALQVPAATAIARSVLPAGEAFKGIENVAALWDDWSRVGAGRDALVVAVGGGLVSDVAGFAAATWQRGVPWIAVPTTVLGMLDAALGGKTGVNTPAGKNQAGAIHHPLRLVADTRCLATLPERRYVEGWAEAVKAGAIGDLRLLELIERDAARLRGRDPAVVEETIARSLAVKAEVVAADPSEGSQREILNFGHTVAHALEHATDHALPHGEAVAIGIIAEARLGETLVPQLAGLAERLARACAALGLPTQAPQGLSRERLRAALLADKKRRLGRLRISLPTKPGTHSATPSLEVSETALLDALLA